MTKNKSRRSLKSGNVAVEFGLISPVIVLMLIGTIDYGLSVYNLSQLQRAVRAGAQYAAVTGDHNVEPGINATDTSAIISTVQNASKLGTNVSVMVVPDAACHCSDGSSISCTDATVSCNDNSAKGYYISITGTYSYTPLVTLDPSGPRVLTSTLGVRVN